MDGRDPLAGERRLDDAPFLRELGKDPRANEHAGLEPAVDVVHGHPHLDRSRLLIEEGIDERDAPGKDLAGVGLRLELDLLGVFDPGEIRLVCVEVDPDA